MIWINSFVGWAKSGMLSSEFLRTGNQMTDSKWDIRYFSILLHSLARIFFLWQRVFFYCIRLVPGKIGLFRTETPSESS